MVFVRFEFVMLLRRFFLCCVLRLTVFSIEYDSTVFSFAYVFVVKLNMLFDGFSFVFNK